MPSTGHLTLGKKERLAGKSLVESLFKGGGSRSMSFFPLRVVYAFVEGGDVPVRLMVSVPKRCFKRAVRRNRVKRQVREAFRKHKHVLHEKASLMPEGKTLAVAFIWLDDHLHDSEAVERRVSSLLIRIGERL